MKNITNILTIIAACLLMGACSSDNLPFENERMAQQSDTDSPVYFCMQLNQQDKSVKEAIILFFNIDGKQWYGAKYFKIDESIQSKSKIIMTLPNIQTRPYELLVVANPVEAVKDALMKPNTQVARWLDKSDIMKLTAKLASTPSENGDFMMSTAQYVLKDGSQNFGTKITEDYFKPTKEEALQHPIELNIERVHAKVNVTLGDNFKNDIKLSCNVDGTEKEISWVRKNIWISNIPQSTYVVKNLDGFDTKVNYEGNRSNWAVMPEKEEYSNKAWNNDGLSFPYYMLENTSDNNKSSVCISGRLKVDGTFQDLFGLHGDIFTKEGYAKFLRKYMNIPDDFSVSKTNNIKDKIPNEEIVNLFKFTAGKCESQYKCTIGVELVTTYQNEENEKKDYYFQFDRGGGVLTEWLKYDEIKDNKSFNALLDKIKNSIPSILREPYYYNKGRNYYFANIPHIDNKFGVVRNHFYELEVTKIDGLGTPVADEEEIIIPEHPEDDNSVMSIKVNVLPWHEVNEDIGFGNK